MMAADEKTISELPTEPPSPKEFWALYTHAVDWQIILHNYLMDLSPDHGKSMMDPAVAVMGFDPASGSVIYYLSREHFPVDKIAALIGQPVEKLAGVEELHLRELKGPDGKPAQTAWERPNVDYWGRA